MWRRLRKRQLGGQNFRRQTPFGRYIVDFFCFERKLVVAVDGGQHQLRAAADRERTQWLEGRGYRVIRFWNNQVLGETEAVLETILQALECETGDPSP